MWMWKVSISSHISVLYNYLRHCQYKTRQGSRKSFSVLCRGLALISEISLTSLEALHFGISSRCWNWTLNSKRLAKRKKWKNWSVVSLDVGHATFTLTNAWCHPFEQGEMKGNESEEVGNLWMMSTVILLDTAVCHFSLLVFPPVLTFHAYLCVCLCVWERKNVGMSVICEKGQCSYPQYPSTFKGWILCPGVSDTLFQTLQEERRRQRPSERPLLWEQWH